jgi:hypothetical protein
VNVDVEHLFIAMGGIEETSAIPVPNEGENPPVVTVPISVPPAVRTV